MTKTKAFFRKIFLENTNNTVLWVDNTMQYFEHSWQLIQHLHTHTNQCEYYVIRRIYLVQSCNSVDIDRWQPVRSRLYSTSIYDCATISCDCTTISMRWVNQKTTPAKLGNRFQSFNPIQAIHPTVWIFLFHWWGLSRPSHNKMAVCLRETTRWPCDRAKM